MGYKFLISRNTRYIFFARTVGILTQFILTPYIIRNVGKEVYGIFNLVFTITGYLNLLDLGIMGGLVRFTALYDGSKEYERQKRLFNSIFNFFIIVGLIGGVILLGFVEFFPKFFNIQQAQNVAIAKSLLLIAAISFSILIPTFTFRGILEGLQRVDIVNSVQIFVYLINILFAYLIFSNNLSISLYYFVSQILWMTSGLVFFFFVKRLLQNYHLKFFYFEKNIFKEIFFSYSLYIFLGNLLTTVMLNFGNIVVGKIISVSAVTFYAVSSVLTNSLRSLNSMLGWAPWLAAAKIEGEKDYGKQKLLVFKGTRYSTMIMIPAVIVLLIYAKNFIINWVGKDFQVSVLPARILIFFWFFNGTIEIAAGLLTAKGFANLFLKYHSVNAVLNVLLAIVLGKIFGITGVALGVTLPMIFTVGFMILPKSLQLLNLQFIEYFNQAIKPNLKSYLIIFLIAVISLLISYPKNIYLTIIQLGVVYFISLIICYTISLNKEERKEVLNLIYK